jgi:hypothetical protein
MLCETSLFSTSTTTTPTNQITTTSSVSLCSSNVCQNGGICVIINGAIVEVQCRCAPNFTGRLCETSLISLTTTTAVPTTTTTAPAVALCPTGVNICQNGGSCVVLNGVELACRCSTSFSGIFQNF